MFDILRKLTSRFFPKNEEKKPTSDRLNGCLYSSPRPSEQLACAHKCQTCPESSWYVTPVLVKPERWIPGITLPSGVFDTEESNQSHKFDSLLMSDTAPAVFSPAIRRYQASNIWLPKTSEALALSESVEDCNLSEAARRLILIKFKEMESFRIKYDLRAWVISEDFSANPIYVDYLSKLLSINGIHNPMSNIQPSLKEMGYENGFDRDNVRIKIFLGKEEIPFVVSLYGRGVDEKGDIGHNELLHRWDVYNTYELLALLVSLPGNETYQKLCETPEEN